MAPRGAPKNAPRGPAATRHGRARKDKDGDLTMGMAPKAKAGVSKSSKANADLASRIAKKKGMLAPGAQRAILRSAAAGDVNMHEAKSTGPRGLIELKIGNWTTSKAAASQDRGVGALISWLEKKASHKLGSRHRPVKIKKSRVDGEDLIISVPAEDTGAILRLNGWNWAGTNVTVKRNGAEDGISAQTSEIKDMFNNVLDRRYNHDEKMLDLSSLGADPALQAKEVFKEQSTTSKFFPAMMKVLENAFESSKDKDEAIVSVSLANNDLTELKLVTTLSSTLPHIRNLDLSNNKFDSVEKIGLWKRRFPQLDHIIVSGNPFEQTETDYAKTLAQWFTKLRTINNVQIRTGADVASQSKAPPLAFPVRPAVFQDEGGIVEGFIRTFFTAYDTDRNALVALYYDNTSTFSYQINTGAPRDPAQTEHTEKQEWDQYIKHSRNLRKITQVPARANRVFKGQAAVAEAFNGLPQSKHPDLATSPGKWMIEAHIQPGVPDTSGQSATGVDGFMITIHGEYEEPNKKKRSFDRTFVIGPGGQSGVRVVNDMLTVRAYGGAQAFEPENVTSVPQPAAAPVLPNGLTIEMAEKMVIELQKQTLMTAQYAKDCLEQTSWNFDAALGAFQQVKASLPADAFVQV